MQSTSSPHLTKPTGWFSRLAVSAGLSLLLIAGATTGDAQSQEQKSANPLLIAQRPPVGDEGIPVPQAPQ